MCLPVSLSRARVSSTAMWIKGGVGTPLALDRPRNLPKHGMEDPPKKGKTYRMPLPGLAPENGKITEKLQSNPENALCASFRSFFPWALLPLFPPQPQTLNPPRKKNCQYNCNYTLECYSGTCARGRQKGVSLICSDLIRKQTRRNQSKSEQSG